MTSPEMGTIWRPVAMLCNSPVKIPWEGTKAMGRISKKTFQGLKGPEVFRIQN